jgi:uncharacterized membrane protein
MAENPYAAPQTADLVRPTGWSAGSGTFTIGQCWSDAWEAAKKNPGLLIGGYLVVMIASFVFAFTVIGYFLALPVMMVGIVRFGLELLDGDSRIGTLFSGFSGYVKWLGRMLLLTLILVVLNLPGSALQLYATFNEDPSLILVGALVSIVWSVVVSLRFMFANFFAVDRDLPAIEALRASWSASGSVWLKLLLLTIVIGIVAMSGLILLGIGILFTGPLAALMLASAYRQIAGRPAPAA